MVVPIINWIHHHYRHQHHQHHTFRKTRRIVDLNFKSAFHVQVTGKGSPDQSTASSSHPCFQLESTYHVSYNTEIALFKIINDFMNAADRGKVIVLCMLDVRRHVSHG